MLFQIQKSEEINSKDFKFSKYILKIISLDPVKRILLKDSMKENC
jgi:hypothetical protein